MKMHVSTYSLASLLLLTLLVGCGGPTTKLTEAPPAPEAGSADPRGFDPLELPLDREVVPAKHPRSGDISGKQVLVDVDPTDGEADSATAGMIGPILQIDSLNSQAYRVQVFTSRVYGDARRAARVAEEIFDQPVHVDYEVPNYKVRVGSFADRYAAESYQQKAKAAGYSNAWVVMVNIGIKEVAPLYGEDTGLFIPTPPVLEDSVKIEDVEGGGPEN